MKTKKKQPTERSLEYLRKAGYTVAVVERWEPHARVRQDLFGCIDILAIAPRTWPKSYCKIVGTGCLGFQVTSDNGGNFAKHRRKAKAEPRLRTWLEAGNRFFLHGWRKNACTGRWEVREEEITLEQLEDN